MKIMKIPKAQKRINTLIEISVHYGRYKHMLQKIYSLNHDIDLNNPKDMYHFTEDCCSLSPDDIVINTENKRVLSDLIDSLLSLDCLSDRQKDYIRLYYFDGYTFEKIGQKYGITREAVRQGLNKALNLIREMVNNG